MARHRYVHTTTGGLMGVGDLGETGALPRRWQHAAGLKAHLTTHGLRRTFNDLMRQVSSGEVVYSIMGYVTERMTEHYSHVRVAEKADAAARVIRLVHPRAESGDESGDALTERKTAG